MTSRVRSALKLYEIALSVVVRNGFLKEIEWQSCLSSESFTESDLLRETAWVILCSGFRESVIRRCFNCLSLCFCDWESARQIIRNRHVCQRTALELFNSKSKIDAIVETSIIVERVGFNKLKILINDNPTNELQRFPFIGPITSYHLAKNLGFQIAKTDRHLKKISEQFGFSDANELCGELSSLTNQPVATVDIVLWRYATLCHAGAIEQVNEA